MAWYSVAIDARRPDGATETIPEDRTDTFMDLLQEHSGLGGGEGDVWTARLSLDVDHDMDAAAAGQRLIYQLADKAGMPMWPPVWVEAIREDVLDEKLSRSSLPDLVSAPEVAEILHVSRQRVHQLLSEHKRFPEPLYRLGSGPLWLRAAIEAFDERWTRKPGRPKRETVQCLTASSS